MNLYLFDLFFLQTGSPLAARQNRGIYLIAIAAVAFLSVLGLILKIFSSPVFAKLRRFDTKRAIHSAAASFGLTSDEESLFTSIIHTYKIKDVNFFIKNDKNLDEVFKKAYASISRRNSQSRQDDLTVLFSIRQKIEVFKRENSRLSSSVQMAAQQAVVLVTPNKKQYKSSVVANEDIGLYVSSPIDELGNLVKIDNLSKIGVFFRHAFVEYIFMSRVLQNMTYLDRKVLLLAHSNSLEPLKNRTYKRQNIFSEVFVGKVKAVSDGKNKKNIEYVPVDGNKIVVKLMDISVGGCRFWCSSLPFAQGDMISLNVLIGNANLDEIFGKILRVNKSPNGNNYHVCFTQVSQSARNKIYSFVYEY